MTVDERAELMLETLLSKWLMFRSLEVYSEGAVTDYLLTNLREVADMKRYSPESHMQVDADGGWIRYQEASAVVEYASSLLCAAENNRDMLSICPGIISNLRAALDKIKPASVL